MSPALKSGVEFGIRDTHIIDGIQKRRRSEEMRLYDRNFVYKVIHEP